MSTRLGPSPFTKVLIGLLGVSLGALVVVLISTFRQTGEVRRAAASPEDPPALSAARGRSFSPRTFPVLGTSPANETWEPGPADPSNDSMKAVAHKIDQYRQEPRDERWAASTEGSIRADLAGIGKAIGLTRFEVTCRSTTCVGKVEWPDRLSAVKTFGEVLHHPYAANCGRGVFLDESSEGPAATATIYFECQSFKNQQAALR